VVADPQLELQEPEIATAIAIARPIATMAMISLRVVIQEL